MFGVITGDHKGRGSSGDVAPGADVYSYAPDEDNLVKDRPRESGG